MTPGDLLGTTYGPVAGSVSADRVVAFVGATGDDPERWQRVAPPAYGAALLFSIAPDFLWREDIAAFTRTLVHVDQAFTYLEPLRIGAKVAVEGRVDRVRERNGAYFVTFLAEMRSPESVLVESASTFLMSDSTADEPVEDPEEPGPLTRAANDEARPIALTAESEVLPSLAKSASRADLIRYAAASGDFNPIHWDHLTARKAGFSGIIVHGLLMASWILQLAAAVSPAERPVAEAKVRFRAPLRAGQPAQANGSIVERNNDHARLRLSVTSDDTAVVTGTAIVPLGEG